MRRKYTESEIKTLEHVCGFLIPLSPLISLVILLFSSIVPMSLNVEPIVFTNFCIFVFIHFCISLICFAVYGFIGSSLDFLRERNKEIDEEDKARQQALLLEAAERIRAQSQIWVSE